MLFKLKLQFCLYDSTVDKNSIKCFSKHQVIKQCLKIECN